MLSPWLDRPARGLLAARAASVDIQEAVQLGERLAIDLALELDDRLHRDPVFVPAPGVELGLAVAAQLDVAVAPQHAQQVPDLLLSLVGAAPVAPDPFFGNLVAQPVAGAAEDAHVRGLEADLLLELAVHRLFRRFARFDASLGELPRVLVDSLAPEQVVVGVQEQDAHVGTVAVSVEHGDTT